MKQRSIAFLWRLGDKRVDPFLVTADQVLGNAAAKLLHPKGGTGICQELLQR